MTLLRMDNVLIVVDELEAAKAFFLDLGMELRARRRSRDHRLIGLLRSTGSEAQSR